MSNLRFTVSWECASSQTVVNGELKRSWRRSQISWANHLRVSSSNSLAEWFDTTFHTVPKFDLCHVGDHVGDHKSVHPPQSKGMLTKYVVYVLDTEVHIKVDLVCEILKYQMKHDFCIAYGLLLWLCPPTVLALPEHLLIPPLLHIFFYLIFFFFFFYTINLLRPDIRDSM